MIHEIEAVKILTNYAEFTILDNDLENILFHSQVTSVPTVKEIYAKAKEIQLIQEQNIIDTLNAKTALLQRLGITEAELMLLFL